MGNSMDDNFQSLWKELVPLLSCATAPTLFSNLLSPREESFLTCFMRLYFHRGWGFCLGKTANSKRKTLDQDTSQNAAAISQMRNDGAD